MLDELLLQALKALAYYAALVVIMRLAGKRLGRDRRRRSI